MSLSCTSLEWRGLTFTSDHSGDYGLRVLRGWDELPDARRDAAVRPGQHGRFDAPSYADERIVVLGGQILSTDRDALIAALGPVVNYDATAPEPLTVTRAGRTLTAYGRLTAFTSPTDLDWSVGLVPYSIEWRCSDPYRYGATVSQQTGLVHDQGGLRYPLYSDGAGNDLGFLDYGEYGDAGYITVTNAGSAQAWQQFTVDGPAPSGFTITETTTHRRLVFPSGVPSGSQVTIDSKTGAVLLDGTSRRLSRREWTPIPAGGSRTFGFSAPAGSPLLTIESADTWW